jgi:hypothetical protein
VKVVVYPHDLAIGGSQLNAIELAARVQAKGHECVVFGVPGPLVDRIADLGLEFVASPDPGRRPSPNAMGALGALVADRGIDVIHGYEWPPAIEAWLVATRQRNVAAVGTVMSMAVAPFLPRTLPLVVGTEQIAAVERASGRHLTTVIEPPVDLDLNSVSVDVGIGAFKQRWGITDHDVTVVTVTRLAHEMKLEGLLVAMETLPSLGSRPTRLVVVGGGPAARLVAEKARSVNDRVGREAVVLTGEIADPRSAYASADVVIGMGGSALRALAFRQPLVVQGERGYWRLLTPASVDEFLWTGWYGVGAGASTGSTVLENEIGPVLESTELRDELGFFGRSLVERRFGLEMAAQRQIMIYEAALQMRPDLLRHCSDAGRSGVHYARYVAARRVARLRGKRSVDDFNSKPVAATGPSRPAAGSR